MDTIEQRGSNWAEVVAAYHAAEAVPVDDDTPDEVFDAAAEAFNRMVATRAPNLAALLEKVTIIDESGGWLTDGVPAELRADIAALMIGEAGQ